MLCVNYIQIFAVKLGFNRYGQTIFSTEDPSEGWDGTYKGNDAPCNMYVYYLKMKTPEGDFVERRGKVLLLD